MQYLYKVVTKVIVSKIQEVLPALISPNQSSFIPCRMGNIIITQELIHSMHTKKREKGFMAIKVDLEKAYDRLNWAFIEDTFQEIGFPNSLVSLVSLIMECIPTSSIQVLCKVTHSHFTFLFYAWSNCLR